MKKITSLDHKLQNKILNFLYEDELFNFFLIDYIQNQADQLGYLYISENKNTINSILHMKFDGNSYFTNFYSKDDLGLNQISNQLTKLNYNKILLTGKRKEVTNLLSQMKKTQSSALNLYYKYDEIHFSDTPEHTTSKTAFRRATSNPDDLKKIALFLIDFFEAKTPEEIATITDSNKILDDLNTGVFFIEYNQQVVGMARYSGQSDLYIDITTVYIAPQYRGKGLGKSLMRYMINQIKAEGKTPITQTSTLNTIARKTYESLGFIKQGDYLFEFIS